MSRGTVMWREPWLPRRAPRGQKLRPGQSTELLPPAVLGSADPKILGHKSHKATKPAPQYVL